MNNEDGSKNYLNSSNNISTNKNIRSVNQYISNSSFNNKVANDTLNSRSDIKNKGVNLAIFDEEERDYKYNQKIKSESDIQVKNIFKQEDFYDDNSIDQDNSVDKEDFRILIKRDKLVSKCNINIY